MHSRPTHSRTHRAISATTALFIGALAWQQCAPAPPPPPPVAAAPATSPNELLSVREVMEFIVDPVADYIFDAAVYDSSDKGTVNTQPVNDDDWVKIERGAHQLAEASYLLKMPRLVAPAGQTRVNQPGKPAPELSTAEIQAKIDGDRALWNSHADQLRLAAVEALKIVKARDVEGIFKAGAVVDEACESCHLEYWYPGDKAKVDEDKKKKVSFDPPKAK